MIPCVKKTALSDIRYSKLDTWDICSIVLVVLPSFLPRKRPGERTVKVEVKRLNFLDGGASYGWTISSRLKREIGSRR